MNSRTLAAAVFAIVLLVAPTPSAAATIAELQAQLAALQAILAQLIAQQHGNTNSSDEQDAEDAIDEAEEAINDADDEIDDSHASRSDINDAEDLLDEAEETLDDAIDEFDDEDWDNAIDLAEEATDLADEAWNLAHNEDEEEAEDDADDAINEAEDAIDDANRAIDISDASEDDIEDAEDLVDDAEELLDEAQDEFDDEDWDNAKDLAEEAREKAEDAEQIANENSDDDASLDVTSVTASEVTVRYEDLPDDTQIWVVHSSGQRYASGSDLIRDGGSGTLTIDIDGLRAGTYQLRATAYNNYYTIYATSDSFTISDVQEARVAFDSKTYAVRRPTLTGDAEGVTRFGLEIRKGDEVIYQFDGPTVLSTGEWSHRITTNLADGTYTVRAYGSAHRLLGSGSFVIRTTTSNEKGLYLGYMDGRQFIRTENITRDEALRNCKQNHVNNPTRSIRCTWNGVEIMNELGTQTEAPTVTFVASDISIVRPAKVTLRWEALGADRCTLNNLPVEVRNSKEYQPQVTTTYHLSCFKGTARTDKSVTVAVASRLTGGQTDNTTAPSIAFFRASPQTLIRGDQESALTWEVTNAGSCTITGGGLNKTVRTHGTLNVSPDTTTTYKLSCTKSTGSAQATATRSVFIYVRQASSSNQSASAYSALENQIADIAAIVDTLFGR